MTPRNVVSVACFLLAPVLLLFALTQQPRTAPIIAGIGLVSWGLGWVIGEEDEA